MHEYDKHACFSTAWLEAFPFKPVWMFAVQPLLSIAGYLFIRLVFFLSKTLSSKASRLFHRFFPSDVRDAKDVLDDAALELTLHQLSQVAHTLYQIVSAALVYMLTIVDASRSSSCTHSWDGYLLFLLQLANSGFFESYASSLWTAYMVESDGQTMFSRPQLLVQIILVLPAVPIVAAAFFTFPLAITMLLLTMPIIFWLNREKTRDALQDKPALRYIIVTALSHLIAFPYSMSLSYMILFLDGSRWEDVWAQDWQYRNDDAWFQSHRAWAHIANLV